MHCINPWSMAVEWTYSVAGLVVGFIVGLTGVGGGSLMTPLLVLGFGVQPAVAVGTDLLYASITKAGGAWVHGRRGNVDWRIAGWLAAGSVPAALLTLGLLRWAQADLDGLSPVITTTLGAALILTACSVLFKDRLLAIARRRDPLRARSGPAATIAVGAVIGAMVTLSSVGAGAVGAAALLFLYPGVAASRIVGTDIVHAVPLALVAGLGHATLGTVDYGVLGWLLLGSLPGIFVGSHFAGSLPNSIVRGALAGVLALVGAKLVI